MLVSDGVCGSPMGHIGFRWVSDNKNIFMNSFIIRLKILVLNLNIYIFVIITYLLNKTIEKKSRVGSESIWNKYRLS